MHPVSWRCYTSGMSDEPAGYFDLLSRGYVDPTFAAANDITFAGFRSDVETTVPEPASLIVWVLLSLAASGGAYLRRRTSIA